MNLWRELCARVYDLGTRTLEEAWLADQRRNLLVRARGQVLEVGGGTGANLKYYREVEKVLITEPDRAMMAQALRKLPDAPVRVEVEQASAESLPFQNASFDTVVSTLVLCTVPDPRNALTEIHRVLRAEGLFLFIEHVRGTGRRAKWQDRVAPIWAFFTLGCHPNRDTVSAIEAAGFRLTEIQHSEPDEFPRLLRPLVTGVATKRH